MTVKAHRRRKILGISFRSPWGTEIKPDQLEPYYKQCAMVSRNQGRTGYRIDTSVKIRRIDKSVTIYNPNTVIDFKAGEKIKNFVAKQINEAEIVVKDKEGREVELRWTPGNGKERR